MKKFFLILCSITLAVYTSAQTGNGSSGNPFYGTITTTVQWSVGDSNYGSTVYVGTSSNPDLTVGTGGHLTIDPGITVIFTQLTTDLFVIGTGQLTAGGTGSQVTFTKDPAKAHWGHISFQNMTGTPASSTFDNCVLEWGYSLGTNLQPLLAGGAIQIDFNNVVITNCVFRNNYANYAGAVIVNSNKNTIIRKSYFGSNNANECGGALIIYSGSTAVIENCIFASNYSRGLSDAGYGGGAIWSYTNTSKVVNCTFVENTADRAGDGIYSYNSSGMRIINSILWGSNDQFGGSATTSTIVTCAFESAKPANAANSIIISDVASDHFTNAGSGDWSLKFVSPCRDAGTTPSPTVPNDFIGNPRIGPYDIGAYEVQYSRWAGTTGTDWAAATNWVANVDPTTGTGDVIIPTGLTNYPTGSSSQNFTIGTGKFMILNPGAKATLGILTNNGTLQLRSDATGISSFIINSHLGNSANVQLYLTGGYIGNPLLRVGRWHYISSPFDPSTPLSISPFTANTYDLARWRDGIQSPASILLGFVGFDGFVYNDSDPADPGTFWGGTFSTLITGRGYNFWDNLSSFNYSLTGKLNTSDVAVNLDFAGAAYENGYNLLGNPFSSGLNWDDIITSVYFTYPSNTSKSLYFTRNNVSCTYIAGVGVPGDVTGLIPPMQGFFTKTYSTGNTITLAAAARVHDNVHARYKGQTIIPLVRLEIDKDSLSKDETVVRFDDKALTTLDNEFDALKMFLSASTTSIYSSDGVSKYSINGQPFPGTEIEIPVVINLQYSGNHKISTNQLQGLENYYVTLKDNTTGFIADLKTTPELSFSAAAGTTSDRFILKITNLTTGVENPVVSNNIFNIYPGQNLINIQTIADEWDGKSGSVRLLDLTGKTVTDLQNAEFRKNSIIQVQAPAATGLYVVEIRSGVKRYVGKIIIK